MIIIDVFSSDHLILFRIYYLQFLKGHNYFEKKFFVRVFFFILSRNDYMHMLFPPPEKT